MCGSFNYGCCTNIAITKLVLRSYMCERAITITRRVDLYNEGDVGLEGE